MEMCSGSEAGSYLRLIDFVYHSTLGLIVIKKKRRIVNELASGSTKERLRWTAVEQGGNNLDGVKDFHSKMALKSKARIWP